MTERLEKGNCFVGYLFFKRLLDIFLSFLMLSILSPLFLLLMLLVKLTSVGPIFYVGKRLGREGKVVVVYKFRTMRVDAERVFDRLYKANDWIKKEWDRYQKLSKDPRCTWIGRWLRKSSLDELPQLLCVLKGDLSMVGPRPHYLSLLDSKNPFSFYADKVLSVKPGLTSFWQVVGRNHLSYAERVALDCQYVEKQSFFVDCSLLLKTIPTLFCASRTS